MKIGALKQIVEVGKLNQVPGDKGEPVKTFSVLDSMRGGYRSVGGKDLLLSGAEMVVRQGTLQTRYYPKADESQYVRIDRKDIYEVVTFNHDENFRFTVWTLTKLNR